MDSLEKEGLLEDLVIVFYGDHESRISKKEFNLLYNYNPVTNDVLNEEYITFGDEPISSDYIERIREHASDVIEVSNGIIKYDLIKKEGKNVGECNE